MVGVPSATRLSLSPGTPQKPTWCHLTLRRAHRVHRHLYHRTSSVYWPYRSPLLGEEDMALRKEHQFYCFSQLLAERKWNNKLKKERRRIDWAREIHIYVYFFHQKTTNHPKSTISIIYIYEMYIDQVRLGSHAHKGALFIISFFNSLAWIFLEIYLRRCIRIYISFLRSEFLKDGVASWYFPHSSHFPLYSQDCPSRLVYLVYLKFSSPLFTFARCLLIVRISSSKQHT